MNKIITATIGIALIALLVSLVAVGAFYTIPGPKGPVGHAFSPAQLAYQDAPALALEKNQSAK